MSTIRLEEVHLNTPAQVKGYLDEAARIVEELELPDDLRVTAFGYAVQLVSNKQVTQAVAGAVDLGRLRHRDHGLG